jgi:hypothetical protein
MPNGTRVTNLKSRKTGVVVGDCNSPEYVQVRYDHEFVVVATPVADLAAE